jgi:thermitase
MGAASATTPQAFVQNEVLLRTKPGMGMLQAIANSRIGAVEVERIPGLEISRLVLPRGVGVGQAIQHFQRMGVAEFVQPNYIYQTQRTPNDTRWSSQYGPRQIRMEQAWDITLGDQSIVVAIVDTGILLTHSDLQAKLVPGRGFVGNSNGNDDNGHGTHCAGIAAAVTNNSLGIAGVGWNVRLMPVKVLSSSGSGSTSAIANGIRWAADNGAKVISLSLGGPSNDSTMRSATDYAWSRNVVIVAAAGNSGTTQIFYPAGFPNVISVAATNSADNRASFSTYGSWVDVAAPGDSIISTYLSNGYSTLSGTSMACPHVAGLAGLLWSVMGSNASNAAVVAAIENNTDNIGRYGIRLGRVNALRALQSVGGNQPQELSPTSADTTRGDYVSGDFNSLRNVDGSYYIIAARSPFLVSDPSAQLTMVTTANGNPFAQIGFNYVGSASGAPADRVSVRVTFFNFQARVWEQVDSRPSSTSDIAVNFTVPDATRFMEPGTNALSARISWFDLGTISPNWTARLDQVRWTLQ